MIKKSISVAFIAAFAAVAAWNMSENKNGVELSSLALENVEALASTEGSGGSGGGIDQRGYKYVGSPRPCCQQTTNYFSCSSTWPDC